MFARSPSRGGMPMLEPVERRAYFSISFLPAVQSQVGAANVIAVGDFTRDGLADVVARGGNQSLLSFFRGTGDGHFVPPAIAIAPPNAGPNVVSLVAADFNRDGKLDLAAANSTTSSNAGNVAVLLGNGNGTFQPATYHFMGPNPTALAVGDFNGDGRPDLTAANDQQWPATYGNGFGGGVLFGTNAGFSPLLKVPLPLPSTTVASLARQVNATAALVAPAGPTLAFGSPVSPLLSPLPYSTVMLTSAASIAVNVVTPVQSFYFLGHHVGIAAGDFSRDGRTDVAVIQSTASLFLNSAPVGVYTLSSAPTTTPASPPTYVQRGPFPNGLANASGAVAADFDRDGRTDLAVAGYRAAGPLLPAFIGTLSALSGTGDGLLGPYKLFNTGPLPNAIAAGRVNNDQFTDIVTGSGVGLSSLTFARPTTSRGDEFLDMPEQIELLA